MNICFLLGKIISEPTFDFLYKCKNISIVNQSPTGIYEKEIDLLRV